MILLAEKVAFGTSPNMYVSFYYEKQRSGANMLYRTKTVIEPLTSPSSYGYYIDQTLTVNNEQREVHRLKENSPSRWSNPIEYISPWYTIKDKTSGTTPVVFYLYGGGGRPATYTYSMEIDPAYTTISSFGVYSQTETSITYSWATTDVISKLEYSFDNVNWIMYSNNVNDKSGRFTVTGLVANTSYNMYIRVTRSDSGLQTISSKVTSITLAYPNCFNVINFAVGEKFNISIYNPMGYRCRIYLLPTNGTKILVDDSISNSMIKIIDSSLYMDELFKVSPNSDKNTYTIVVECDAVSSTTTSPSATYTIPNNSPIFTNFEYMDDNSEVVTVTEDNQAIIKNKSILKVKISSANKMVAKDYALGARYEISCSNRTKSLDYSEDDSEIELGTINLSGIMNIVVKAIDSRGFSTTLNKTINVIDYTNIIQNNDAYRINNFENETKLKCEGTYALVEVNGTSKNTIEEIKFRHKESGKEYGDYTNIVPTINGNKYSSLMQTFDLDNQKSFIFEVLVRDRFGWSEPVELLVDEGVPITYYNADKKNFGVGCINEHEEYSFETKGKIYANDDIILKSGNKVIDAAYCSMKVNGITRAENDTDIILKSYHAPLSVGGFVADISIGKLLIPKGTKAIEVSGMICGYGYAKVYFGISDKDGNAPPNFEWQETGVLFQGDGNLYWKLALPTKIVELDEKKSYEIVLSIGGYNEKHFEINAGFGNNSWIQAKKIR